jgi:hypothetical protein
MEDVKSVWDSKQDIFTILLLSWTSGCRQSYYFFLIEGPLSEINSQKHKRFGIKIYKPCDETGYTYYMAVYSFLDGGEEISYSDFRFIFVDDILQRWGTSVDTNSTQQRLSVPVRDVMQPKWRVNCEWWEEKRTYWNVAKVWCVSNKMMFRTLPR